MTAVPPLARALGFAGLLPFAGGATGLFFCAPGGCGVVGFAVLAYGAVIVSFLGGIHWGLVMRSVPGDAPAQALSLQLVWGVVPSLLAWLALLLPPRWGLLLTAVSLLVCFAVDDRVYRQAGLTYWLGLRAQLTAVASLCCFVGAWLSPQL
jgi:hypothetical protein